MANFEPKGKAQKSFYLLKNLGNQIDFITTKVLKIISENIQEIINNNQGKIFDKDCDLNGSVSPSSSKQRSNVKDMPDRIEFKLFKCFKFYIDFTVEISKQDQQYDAKGSIIYGTNRSLCFTECPYPKTTIVEADKKCDACDRIVRCDKLEDKPLLKFSVDRDGMIQSPDKFEDKLWMIYVENADVEEKKDKNIESLLDLHYQAVEHILEEAFYWANENLLP
ncbi:MAG: hypothetical protein ABIJ52_04350 [Pseudomonadota bacterium]